MGQVYIPQDLNYPALRLDIDRVHAAELGLTQKDVVDNVITALNSNSMIAPNYWVDRKSGNDYFLTVQYFENGQPAIHDLADLTNIPIHAPEPEAAHDAGCGREGRKCSDADGGGSLSDSAGHRRLRDSSDGGSGKSVI